MLFTGTPKEDESAEGGVGAGSQQREPSEDERKTTQSREKESTTELSTSTKKKALESRDQPLAADDAMEVDEKEEGGAKPLEPDSYAMVDEDEPMDEDHRQVSVSCVSVWCSCVGLTKLDAFTGHSGVHS